MLNVSTSANRQVSIDSLQGNPSTGNNSAMLKTSDSYLHVNQRACPGTAPPLGETQSATFSQAVAATNA
jgi:hypothetical protein